MSSLERPHWCLFYQTGGECEDRVPGWPSPIEPACEKLGEYTRVTMQMLRVNLAKTVSISL